MVEEGQGRTPLFGPGRQRRLGCGCLRGMNGSVTLCGESTQLQSAGVMQIVNWLCRHLTHNKLNMLTHLTTCIERVVWACKSRTIGVYSLGFEEEYVC